MWYIFELPIEIFIKTSHSREFYKTYTVRTKWIKNLGAIIMVNDTIPFYNSRTKKYVNYEVKKREIDIYGGAEITITISQKRPIRVNISSAREFDECVKRLNKRYWYIIKL